MCHLKTLKQNLGKVSTEEASCNIGQLNSWPFYLKILLLRSLRFTFKLRQTVG